MKSKEFKIKASDGVEIHVYEWLPDNVGNIKGIVQIAHGMAEHAARYKDFASFLTTNDYAVYANDHRGHGKTAGDLKNVGYIAPKNGWEKYVSDFKSISLHIQETNQDKPLYVMGHSMGSFLLRKYILDQDLKLKGAILSGTGGDPGLLGQFGKLITRIMMVFFPGTSLSPFMDNLSFGAFNKPFKPNRTKFDWLSRDNANVDKYVNDPYCGGIFSIKFFNDLVGGLLFVSKQINIANTPKDLPVLFFSGEQDPVGTNGKGVKEVYSKFKKAGVKDVTIKLFPDGRHEMLNEINNKEVYEYVLDWIDNKLNT